MKLKFEEKCRNFKVAVENRENINLIILGNLSGLYGPCY